LQVRVFNGFGNIKAIPVIYFMRFAVFHVHQYKAEVWQQQHKIGAAGKAPEYG